MKITTKPQVLSDELAMKKIYLIRGKKAMIDNDLAALYGVQTKVLKQAVKRNTRRFPEDFMFVLTHEETKVLRSQFVTSKSGSGGTRYLPSAFTEQGVAMLSSILNSDRAIDVNIHIIRVFAKMRELLLTHKDILQQLEKIEKKLAGHDADIAVIFNYLKKLSTPTNIVKYVRRQRFPDDFYSKTSGVHKSL